MAKMFDGKLSSPCGDKLQSVEAVGYSDDFEIIVPLRG